MRYSLILLLLLAGCASQPQVDYSEISARYPAEPQPERIQFDFQAACNDKGECLVQETRLRQAADVITKLNDTVQHWVDAYNQRGRALAECEYGKAQRDATIQYQEDLSFRQQLVSAGKQLLIIAGCGAALW